MKTKTTQLLIGVAAIALIAVASYAYATYYISGLTAKTTELNQQISDAQEVYKQAQSLHDALASAAVQKDKIAGYFVPANGAVDFVSNFEKTANSYGLDYTTQDISQNDNDMLSAQNKELLQVSFSAQGSWKNVMRLLKTVESLPYGVSVSKIDMSASGTTASSTRKWSTSVIFAVVKTKDK